MNEIKQWALAAGVRAVKTAAQSANGTGAPWMEIDG